MLTSFSTVLSDLCVFLRSVLPPKFIAEAEAKGMPADEMYCLTLLDSTGVVR